MDFQAMLANLFNPGGPMDLSTGKTAAPTGGDMMKGLGKGVGLANIIADTIGGVPTYKAPPPKPQNDLASLLKGMGMQQQQPQQSPMEQLLQRLFGMKPTNPVAPNMGPINPMSGGGTQIPLNTGGPQGGTGGLY